MRAFAFEQPTSLADAFVILSRSPDARFLAGGTDLIIRLRDGTIRTSMVIDVKRVRELSASIDDADGLVIGARTVMTQLLEDARVRSRYTALAEAAAFVGSVQIRNRATLAGNVVNASPAADTIPALLVFDATIVVAGLHGVRRIPIDEVFVRSAVTTIAPSEIVTAIELPAPPGPWGSVHLRRTRRRGHDLAAVTVACAVLGSGETRLAYGSVGPRPVRVTDTSGVLADPGASDEARGDVLDHLFIGARPSARSMRASPDYRLAMLRLLGLRGAAIARARLAHGPDAGGRSTAESR